MTFKDHFSGHAGLYRDARPVYPTALFDWLAAQTPRRVLAWDCGCGNGQASTELAARFDRVHASDPSADQVAAADARPNIDYRVESAERCSLRDHSVDLVCVAQALHWFDFGAFHAEARRVLKPGALFAAWAYSDCRTTPAVDALKDRVYVDLAGPFWPPERALVDTGYRTLPFPFEAVAAPAFAMSVDWSVDQFLAYLRSWSATQRYIRHHGADPVAQVEDELRAAWGAPDRVRPVSWDFHLLCGRR